MGWTSLAIVCQHSYCSINCSNVQDHLYIVSIDDNHASVSEHGQCRQLQNSLQNNHNTRFMTKINELLWCQYPSLFQFIGHHERQNSNSKNYKLLQTHLWTNVPQSHHIPYFFIFVNVIFVHIIIRRKKSWPCSWATSSSGVETRRIPISSSSSSTASNWSRIKHDLKIKKRKQLLPTLARTPSQSSSSPVHSPRKNTATNLNRNWSRERFQLRIKIIPLMAEKNKWIVVETCEENLLVVLNQVAQDFVGDLFHHSWRLVPEMFMILVALWL